MLFISAVHPITVLFMLQGVLFIGLELWKCHFNTHCVLVTHLDLIQCFFWLQTASQKCSVSDKHKRNVWDFYLFQN